MSPAFPNNKLDKIIMKSGVKVLSVAGASGGHIYPAVSLLDELKDSHPGIDTLLVLPKRNIKSKVFPYGYKIKYISITPIVLRADFKFLLSLLRLIKGSFQSLFLLIEFRPDIVIGFGCIESAPLLFFAWLFRIKTLIHEQNVIPGRANKLLAAFADKVAVSFPETINLMKDFRSKIALTGNPVRKELEKIDREEALNFFGFDRSKFTILVMGGSLGSHRINEAFLKAVSVVSDKGRLQIIHLTGVADYELLNKSYKNLDVDSKILDFLKAMHYAYSASDLVISRAGATTIAEISFFKLPAILIPYPYAYRHQLANAKVLQQKGCALIIEDEELEKGALTEVLRSVIDDALKLKGLRSGYDGFAESNASRLLAAEALSLISQ